MGTKEAERHELTIKLTNKNFAMLCECVKSCWDVSVISYQEVLYLKSIDTLRKLFLVFRKDTGKNKPQ